MLDNGTSLVAGCCPDLLSIEQRLGVRTVAFIKAHFFFFCGIDWNMALKHEYELVFKPNDAHFCTGSNPQILHPSRLLWIRRCLRKKQNIARSGPRNVC
ncbi:hypothetical protein DL95DRAFT_383346 [Leptodontidium sp. 2 PMI_412]|nr:hypothetical protein DL95DRAFT_383346 [Leptodontidium sp. 2 PMI_412]